MDGYIVFNMIWLISIWLYNVRIKTPQTFQWIDSPASLLDEEGLIEATGNLHLVDGVIIDGVIDVSGFPRAVICLLSCVGGSIKRPELALGASVSGEKRWNMERAGRVRSYTVDSLITTQ